MTKQKAIDGIKNILQGDWNNDSIDALQIAIEALNESIELDEIRNIISNAQKEKYERLENLINENTSKK